MNIVETAHLKITWIRHRKSVLLRFTRVVNCFCNIWKIVFCCPEAVKHSTTRDKIHRIKNDSTSITECNHYSSSKYINKIKYIPSSKGMGEGTGHQPRFKINPPLYYISCGLCSDVVTETQTVYVISYDEMVNQTS